MEFCFTTFVIAPRVAEAIIGCVPAVAVRHIPHAANKAWAMPVYRTRSRLAWYSLSNADTSALVSWENCWLADS